MAMTVNSVSFKKTLVCATGQASRESGYSRHNLVDYFQYLYSKKEGKQVCSTEVY